MGKIIIYSNGSNESTLFSAFDDKNPIFTNKEVGESSNNLIRIYPDICKKIAEYFDSSFAMDLPSEINLSQIDSNPRNLLVEMIFKKINKIKV